MTTTKKKAAKSVSSPEIIVVEEWRKWAALNPELLALIFVKIVPVDEMMKSVPLVCKGWLEVVAGPYCWSEVDVQGWCRRRNDSDAVDMVVKKVVRRSKCMLQRLFAYRVGESGFFYLANCGKYLKELHIPMSVINDTMIQKHMKPLPNLTVLDISNCFQITAKGLAAFGNQCKSLVYLKRNMPYHNSSLPIDDSEVKSIADTMPSLKTIELTYGNFGDSGLHEIINKCKSLTHLDILGSWNVELDGDLLEICEKLEYFQKPWTDFDSEFLESEISESYDDEELGSYSD
ncbi:F-box protein FBW2-like [Rutidosis leptorrhynchoides]|uniref:F-box protein FBW2-like n=1 Tax=Rutidosis leptorrhynchoides TaxID=125765 RepID=UPI003A993B44